MTTHSSVGNGTQYISQVMVIFAPTRQFIYGHNLLIHYEYYITKKKNDDIYKCLENINVKIPLK